MTSELVEAWLSARAERDLERLARLTTEDAVWHSPVEGPRVGRTAVVEEVRRGFENSERFETMLLSLQCERSTAAARIRNVATRNGKALDSVQTLYLRVEQGLVSEIHVRVDDQEAVEDFWS